ncbi:hypothetical protein JN01_0727 [Entomoplasma freundtii]|uniref:Uncharacterized protein n=1 Tax=Entomoplasma freundtii TaxID=74700 RepID=A0A2K8NRN2_9MOLU|nr:hypothetical protein [Entomoplasma freundtii]ATZ16505.1 hypothetical protein EFREU_v1c04800 [Entomoplasma freundtii]TDY56035.1 hypothetical protein JN01_0727 [Entomoplasma freundtii]
MVFKNNLLFSKIQARKTNEKSNDNANNKANNDTKSPHDSLFDLKQTTGIHKELTDFNQKMAKSPLIATWTLSFFFLLLPAIATIAAIFFKLDQWELGWNLIGFERLITGGTNRLLTFDGGQWWRFLTYGFAAPGSGTQLSIIILIFGGATFFKTLKIVETHFGVRKTLLSFFGAYLIVGFFMSITCPEVITGGLFPMLGILIGLTLGGLGTSKETIPTYIRSRLMAPLIWMIILPLFNLNMAGDYIPIVVGMAAGMVMMGFLTIKTQSRYSVIAFSFILGALLFLPFIFAIVPQKYSPAPNQTIATAIDFYHEHSFLPNLEKILAKLGWNRGQGVIILR